MIILKCTNFIEFESKTCTNLDCQVRQFEDEARIVYIGQDGQVIQVREDELEKLFKFLRKAKKLKFTSERVRWLKSK